MNSATDAGAPAKLTPSERVQALVSGTAPDDIQETPKRRLNADLQNTSIFFGVSVALGMVLVLTHGIRDRSGLDPDGYIHMTTAGLWALTCLACGAAGGFLFGIPKVRQRDGTPGPSGGGATPAGGNYHQQVNTNLEEISDWITKIIVGLGLINIQHIPGFFDRLAQRLTVGQSTDQKAFALSLIVYFLVIGFLFGYLITRMFLQRAFGAADQAANGGGDPVQAAARDTVRKAAETEKAAEKTLEASKDSHANGAGA